MIVGAGIVGLTVANELITRHSSAKVVILEKESGPGMHASGRNSGVLHSGIYYSSDTFKARVCSEGARLMVEFADEENIALSKSGKVILATSEDQLPTVDQLLKNATENNIFVEKIDNQQLRELEPYAVNNTVAALYSPQTSVIDSQAVVKRLKIKLEQLGVSFLFGSEVLEYVGNRQVKTTFGKINFGFLYNCAGAYADRIAKMFGVGEQYTLVPFKGIYWMLGRQSTHKVKSNIYPVPDTSLPFLGVHLTRVVNGDVYVGPTAIPAFGRENYGKIEGIRFGEGLKVTFQLSSMYLKNMNNFRKMVHLELGKYRKENFLSAAKKLVPSLEGYDLVPTTKSGIRPQLVNRDTGELVMDFIIEENDCSLHVLNSISPAFTSSFAFAKHIVNT